MRRLQWILLTLCFSVAGAAWADPPDPCCVADVNGDGVVDQGDYDYCAGVWVPGPPPECDLDGDGTAWGVSDVNMMAACWGTTCAAGVPSLTPIGAGLAAGMVVAAGAWVYRRRRSSD